MNDNLNTTNFSHTINVNENSTANETKSNKMASGHSKMSVFKKQLGISPKIWDWSLNYILFIDQF